MSYVFVDWQLTSDDFVGKFWHILNRLPTSKCGSFPNSASDKLKRSSSEFFSSGCNSNNHRLSKPSVSHLKSVSHNLDITSAVICKINAPFLI